VELAPQPIGVDQSSDQAAATANTAGDTAAGDTAAGDNDSPAV
jgi:hypothetical protein